MLAILRPDDWEWLLLVHLLGVFLLVAGMVAVVVATALDRGTRRGSEVALLRRIAFRTLLGAVLPGFVAMRVAGQWLESKEEGELFTGDPAWIGIGYIVSDVGVLVLIALIVLAWLGFRGAARGNEPRSWPARAVLVLASVYLAALVVATWAMTTKPD